MTTRASVLVGLSAALSLSLGGTPARADRTQDCVSSYEQTQALRNEGKLRRARTEVLACAQDTCPAVVRKDCNQWLTEIDASIPTVVFEARDSTGADTSEVRVFFDGDLLKERLDGKSTLVDPGEHEFRYELAGASSIEQRIVVREGEKNRKLLVSFPTPGADTVAISADPVEPEEDGGGVPPAAWVLGGVGVVGIGAFATFGLLGRSQKSDLETTCAPTCSDDDVSSVRTKLIVADVSLGVGILALGVATYLVLTASPAKPVAETARTVTLDVKSLPGGGGAWLVGRF